MYRTVKNTDKPAASGQSDGSGEEDFPPATTELGSQRSAEPPVILSEGALQQPSLDCSAANANANLCGNSPRSDLISSHELFLWRFVGKMRSLRWWVFESKNPSPRNSKRGLEKADTSYPIALSVPLIGTWLQNSSHHIDGPRAACFSSQVEGKENPAGLLHKSMFMNYLNSSKFETGAS
ncbi:hypothetical protein Taro_031388 [Colocasia esculenta]|uniref:Uncharacterized protein n=1 Tax=Colocasia esculenta TaxID=4460 RepID=A0A843VRT2_COLES|nr:hypothetical protein [Colocasia esculenta]